MLFFNVIYLLSFNVFKYMLYKTIVLIYIYFLAQSEVHFKSIYALEEMSIIYQYIEN